MNDKPKYETDVVSCPYCGMLDNVALIHGNNGVLWCQCGVVIRLLISEEGQQVLEYERLYKMI